jgi:hypothetical protein
MYEIHGTFVTNQKQIQSFAYFFTIYIKREHGMEQALSREKHKEL